jgi:hypothetical protein
MRGSILGDQMGLGKTLQVLVTYSMNYVLVLEKHDKKLQPDQRPSLDEYGQFKGRDPRVGATFLSAYPSGIEPWPRDWCKMMKGSLFLLKSPPGFQPKITVLHSSGSMW